MLLLMQKLLGSATYFRRRMQMNIQLFRAIWMELLPIGPSCAAPTRRRMQTSVRTRGYNLYG
jgi:hypothetical protein